VTKQQIKKLIGTKIKIDHFLDSDVFSNNGRIKKVKLEKAKYVWIAGVTELQEGVYIPDRWIGASYYHPEMHVKKHIPCLVVITNTQGHTEFTSIPKYIERKLS
jgi:hypothetical protein